MVNWVKIRLLESRLSWWRSKYDYRKKKFDEYRTEAQISEKMHHPVALGRAKAGMQKWGPIVGEAAREVNKYVSAIAKLKPKPNLVEAKERDLHAKYPDTHDPVRKVVAKILVANPEMYVTATTGGNHAVNSYHFMGRAYDLGANSQGPKDRCGKWCNDNISSRLTEGIHNPNLSVKFGNRVSASFWGSSTWSGHVDHVHVAV